MWENRELLDGLRAIGADIQPSEPGVASVRIALPPVEADFHETELHRPPRLRRAGRRCDRPALRALSLRVGRPGSHAR